MVQIVPLIFLTIFVVLFGSGLIFSYVQTRKSARWPSTLGRVTASFIKEKMRKGRTRYKPRVEYTYTVNGATYSGKRFTYGSRSPIRTREEAQKFLAPYPVGAEVQVFYNPKDPSQCCLFSGGEGGILAMAGALVVIVIVWLIVLFGSF